MRGLFWFLGIAFLAVAASLALHYNEGFVLLVVPPWSVRLTLNLLVLMLLAAFVVGYLLVRAFSLTLGLPERARAYRAQRQREQVAKVLEEAVRLLFEGRFGHALRRAEAAYQAGHAPGTAALIAARAAQRMRETNKVLLWLNRAREYSREAEAAALMVGAEMAVEMSDFSAALGDLQTLYQRHGRHIAALRLELRARQGLGDVPGVLKLVRHLEKRGGLQPDLVREIRVKIHREAIRQRGGESSGLMGYFEALPEAEKDLRLVRDIVLRLHHLGAEEQAIVLIEKTLKPGDESNWSSELAALYGELKGGAGLKERIARAEVWLKSYPRDGGVLLCLGRLCEQQRLWGKARSYLEASVAVEESRAAHLGLARLLDSLGDVEGANRHFRRAAEFSGT